MTTRNPFKHRAFKKWSKRAGLPHSAILEPFAGENKLIGYLQDMNLCESFSSFDILPRRNSIVVRRDTLRRFPTGFDVCVTNPPWLAKNASTVLDMPFPKTDHDDMYKFALELCLKNCKWVAILVPESFIRAGIFKERLTDFVSLTSKMFDDTMHPVGLALFQPSESKHINVWTRNGKSRLSDLESLRPKPDKFGVNVTFNDPDGNVGLIALDSTSAASIRFCDVDELELYDVKITGRHITKLKVDGRVNIKAWNRYIDRFRRDTCDVLLTCYRGTRSDGMYRRRLDWDLARGIIHAVK